MIQYKPSFVDTSGMTQGIVNGMMQAAQIKQQQDLIVQKDLEDFQKNYDPRKLRDQDLASFTMAFKGYKEAALRYSRMNRSGGKPEEMAVASNLKDKALNEMNSLYTKSTKASNHQAEYSEYIKNARLRGYAIPESVNNNYMQLSNNSIDKIDLDNMPSAWSNPLVAQEVDVKKMTDYMDAMGARLKEKATTYTIGRPIGKTAGGKVLTSDIATTTSARNAKTVVGSLDAYIIAHPEAYNAAKTDYENLVKGVKANDAYALKKFDDIRTELGYGADVSVDKLKPSEVYGYNFYTPTVTNQVETDARAKMENQTESEAFDRQYKAATLAQKAKEKPAPSFEHPSSTINKVVNNYDAYPNPKSGNISFTPKTGDKDITREFTSYTIPNTMGGKMQFRNVLYNPGNVDAGIKPFITYSTSEDPTTPQYSSLEQFNQFLVKTAPDVTFKGGQPIQEYPSTTIPSVVPATNKSKGKYDPLDLRL
jgi:hypothetical protein